MSELTWRLFDKRKDFPVIYGWWKRWNQARLSPDLLPDLGIVVCSDPEAKIPLAVSWLYMSNSRLAMIGWTTSSPDVSARKRIAAAKFSIECAEREAQTRGARYVLTFSSRSSLTGIFKRQAFTTLKPHDVLWKTLTEAPYDLRA